MSPYGETSNHAFVLRIIDVLIDMADQIVRRIGASTDGDASIYIHRDMCLPHGTADSGNRAPRGVFVL